MANPFIKIRSFLTEVFVELKKSAWPTRSELVDSTLMVLVTVTMLGIFVAIADVVFTQFVRLLTGAV
jgi:preprotein translocase subunit SecE